MILPVVPSRAQIARLIEGASILKHRAILDASCRLDAMNQETVLKRIEELACAGWLLVGAALMSGCCKSPETAATSDGACANDFECGHGSLCAKPPGQYRGTCARAVNRFGGPDYSGPRLESVGPGQRQCSVGVACPIGFRCMNGHCMK